MNTDLKQHLIALAHHYNTPDFIASDPVQFPHRYTQKQDIEISAFVTAWISWGNRRQIIKTADHIDHNIFRHKPHAYLMSGEWKAFSDDTNCFYRTCRHNDFHALMNRLYNIYNEYGDLENAVVTTMDTLRVSGDTAATAATALSTLFSGVNGIADAHKGSPCKRLWFFLRWMVRRDGIVDLGIWHQLSPQDLIIPLDTHVFQTARELGITSRRSADMKTAVEITNFFRAIFPDDPTLGDFALFGLGIEHAGVMLNQSSPS